MSQATAAGTGPSASPVFEAAEVRPSPDPGWQHEPKGSPRSRRTKSQSTRFRPRIKFVWRNYQYRAPAKQEELTHLVVIWILLLSPIMVCHVCALQPVASVAPVCVSNADAHTTETNAVVLQMNAVAFLPSLCARPQQLWPTDAYVWFTTGCVSMRLCVRSACCVEFTPGCVCVCGLCVYVCVCSACVFSCFV